MKKNIAVAGCGHWGKNLVRNLHDLGVLWAVSETSEERLVFCQQNYPDVTLYPNFNTMLEDSRVEGVVIATPAATHYALTKEALFWNKDVMCEKPIALRYKEGEELVALAKEKGRILMMGHILLYHPAIKKLKEMVDSGELGRIKYISSNRLNMGKFRTEENILWSFAPHDISVILYLLNEMPATVSASGGSYLNPDVADVTTSLLSFPSGVKSHVFVSWLHPYKEQKLVVVGGRKMALFDDVNSECKLLLYDHKIDWIKREPVPRLEEAKPIEIADTEPLRAECEHFIECMESRKAPLTDGEEGLRVLRILEACQSSLERGGKRIHIEGKAGEQDHRAEEAKYFVHETSRVDEPNKIGDGTKIWHFTHVLKNCTIGKNCVFGQNVSVGPNVVIGDNVKIQNNVSVYEGVTLEDDVFCGPSMVFTNVINPRSHWPRKDEFKTTLVKRGASLGANSTILCGTSIGAYAFVGSGALVTKDVPNYALVFGVPAKIQGWMCYCGEKLGLSDSPDLDETAECASCGRKYNKKGLAVSEVP